MPPVVMPTASSIAGASHQPARPVALPSAPHQPPSKHVVKPSMPAINVMTPNGASTFNVLEGLQERERILSNGALSEDFLQSTFQTVGENHQAYARGRGVVGCWLGTSIGGVTVLLAAVTGSASSSQTGPATAEKCWELSLGWHQLPHHLTKLELWHELRNEKAEPILASNLHSSILVHNSLEESLAFILANKLSSSTLLPTNLMQLIQQAYEEDPGLVDAAVADMQAVRDRDPACLGFSQVLLWFKGFQAIQSQRIAHWLWTHQRKPLALALQSRISSKFQVDIHPAAYLGRGVMMDHATGVVIGETAVIGDNVSMLHHVTIGGSGIRSTIRHPTIGHGVLLGAGATVLGPINVGSGSKVGSSSVVVRSLPPKCVAVGVPARVIKQDKTLDPCQSMDQAEDFVLYFEI